MGVTQRGAAPTETPHSPSSDASVDTGRPSRRGPTGLLRRVAPLALIGVIATGVVLRFVTTSPLWLDEALSVHIARLPVGEIPEALRHDGHPPLYYVLLHGWMQVFGDGAVAVRTLSGLFALVMLPLAWLVARRVGGARAAWATVVLLALNPYAIRYATETRMYSLLMVLILCGWLLMDDALRRPTRLRLVGIAAVSGALLLTQYWAFYVLGAVGLLLVVRVWRTPDRETRKRTVPVLLAVAAGGIAFLPWLPSFLYQAQHTGTPWARQQRPTTVAMITAIDFAGGIDSETAALAIILLVLVGLALFGRTADQFRIELDVRTRADMRLPLLVGAVTFSLAIVAGYLSGSAYASRYAAVFFPIFIVAAGVGLTRVADPTARIVLLSVAVALSCVGVYRNVTDDRTQGGAIAEAVRDDAVAGDVVAFCPDQLGPSTTRAGLPPGVDAVVYPTLGSPLRVDWVDYQERNEAADPTEFVAELLNRAGPSGAVYLVHAGGYRTFGIDCERIRDELTGKRPRARVLVREDATVFEHAALTRYLPPR